jgi:cytochrome c peroxidase
MLARPLVLLLLLIAPAQQAQAPLPRDELPDAMLSDPPPLGLPDDLAAPADPRHAARLALGRKLFFDPILSADRTVACASCHQPEHGFSSPDPRPVGAFGRHADRHAPTLFNRALGTRQMWDGRAATLGEQVLLPIENPNEMALPLADALARLHDDAAYCELFSAAFEGGAVEGPNLSSALTAFVGRLWLGNSAVDRFRAGDTDALGDAERSGLWVWESKGRCWRCHSGPNFSDESFHNTGIGARDGKPEPGRFAITSDPSDRGRFKVPTLRGLVRTAPYMHDGSLATLADVVAFYRRGANPNDNLDPLLAPLDLTDEDAAHLVAFLEALSRTD